MSCEDCEENAQSDEVTHTYIRVGKASGIPDAGILPGNSSKNGDNQ